MFKKYFKYDTKTLDYRPVNFTSGFSVVISTIILVFICGTFYGKHKKIESLTDYEKEMLVINVKANNEFSQSELVDLLKKLNVKFPHIVLAQSKIETGNFRSKIFRENHNLFGMKEAVSRITTAEGTQFNHAYYLNWRESVYDYAFYQNRYLTNVRTESEYYAMLSASYAEASNYVEILKSTVEKQNLKSLF
jgi:uncharacterized FlgJ-related protein